jgi:hypothetical protein
MLAMLPLSHGRGSAADDASTTPHAAGDGAEGLIWKTRKQEKDGGFSVECGSRASRATAFPWARARQQMTRHDSTRERLREAFGVRQPSGALGRVEGGWGLE